MARDETRYEAEHWRWDGLEAGPGITLRLDIGLGMGQPMNGHDPGAEDGTEDTAGNGLGAKVEWRCALGMWPRMGLGWRWEYGRDVVGVGAMDGT